MVKLTAHDLLFILQQIKIAEDHAAGGDLKTLIEEAAKAAGATGTAAPQAHLLPYGLRTVDGTYNNLLEGRQAWGAADNPFVQLGPRNWVTESDDSIVFGAGSPNPVVFTDGDYSQLGAPSSQSQGLGGGTVVDADPRIISNLIVDQTSNNPAATMVYEAMLAAGKVASRAEMHDANGNLVTHTRQVVSPTGEVLANIGDPVYVYTFENFAPDIGDSAPYNSMFTLFGQFFDHGLDLVAKSGNGTVYIPLSPDDPLYNPNSPNTNFMAMTRAATDSNGEVASNTTTPWVDQNQTYTSHPSHQVFLREYMMFQGKPVATGDLLNGDRGLPTWADIKEQARTMLGINLTDANVNNVPLLRTDPYGKFIPDPVTGFAQVIVGLGADGIPNTADDLVISGTAANPVNLNTAVLTGHAFLDDIAHAAAPVTLNGVLQADNDSAVGYSGGFNSRGQQTAYDNELLDAHYITGDGRGNENIGLTSIHHVFHSEHNHVVADTKQVILDTRDLAFINEWLLVPITSLAAIDTQAEIDALVWNGERLFQTGRFTTEMQYQHLVFEEFARKMQPDIDAFLFEPTSDINPAIFAEFAHAVYRFGHSMLNEDIDRMVANGDGTFSFDNISLFDGFLNPLALGAVDAQGNVIVDHDTAAGAVIRGMSRQGGNEIDEFVTNVLRNQLVGIPLDLAALNIARGRDVGLPTLNQARTQFYNMAGQDTQLKPYTSWVDFALNMENPESIVNFIAAYGRHPLIEAATTLDGKRAAAALIVLGGNGAPADRLDFLNSTGAWASQESGFNEIDLWIGGLAEKKMDFGGMLGSTFAFVFELQLENLQFADRFYYLSRVQGLNLLNELENNSLSQIIMRNTDFGENSTALPGDIFATPTFTLEMDIARQEDYTPVSAADLAAATAGVATAQAAYTAAVAAGDAAEAAATNANAALSAAEAAAASDAVALRAAATQARANADALNTTAAFNTLLTTLVAANATDAFALQAAANNAQTTANATDATSLQAAADQAMLDDQAAADAQAVLDAAVAAEADALADRDQAQADLDALVAANAPQEDIDAAQLVLEGLVTAYGAAVYATTAAQQVLADALTLANATDAVAMQAAANAAAADDAAAGAAQAAAAAAIAADAALNTALSDYIAASAADQAAEAAAVAANALANDAEAADGALAVAQAAAAAAAAAANTAGVAETAALTALHAATAALAALQVDNGKDPLQTNPLLAGVMPLVERKDLNNDGVTDYLRYNGVDHVVIGGTGGNDTIIAGEGDDTVWGYGGDDTIEAGYGVDHIHGGDGDDIITNAGTDIGAMDFLHGEGGNDVINGGSGLALIFGNEGNDFILAGPDGKHLLGGLGTDFVRGGEGLDFVMGNEGDDWLEGGDHFDTLAGENSELFFNSSIIGHDVMNGGKSDTDYDAESGDDIMFQGEGIQRNNGMAGFDWIIQKGDPNAANIDLGIPLFATQEAFILRDRNDLVEGASGWVHDDVIVGRARVVGARAELQNTAAIPGPNSILESFSNALLEKNVDLIDGLRELVAHKTRVTAVDANGVAYTYTDANGVVRQEQIVIDTSDASDILLGGGGNDVISGLGGDDIIDGDKWLNVRIRIKDANGNEIGSADGMTTQVFSPTGQLLFGGRTLDALMFDRTLNPGQLEIVREILDGDSGNSSVDTAVFTDIFDRYTITGNADGSVTVSHTGFNAANFPAGPEGALNPVSDGTDRLYNIEKLRFWDGINGFEEFSIGQVVPFPATGAVFISDTTPLQGQLLTADASSIADQNGLGVFQYQWQRSSNGTTWQNIAGANASSFALPDAAGTAVGQYFGDLIRVVVTFEDGIGDIERIVSAATSPVGVNYSAANSNNGVTFSGRAGDDVIVGSNQADTFTGMAGDDTISGGGGADTLFGGDGNDVLSGGAGADTLNGGAGDDVLTGGTGNDILGGGLGTDRVDYTGAILNYTLATNGTDIIITDTIGNDGQDTIRNVETLRFGAVDYTIVLGGAGADTALSGPTGLVGSKAIFGLAGGDTLIGGTASDILVGGAGNDAIDGGEGNDFIYQIGASDGRDFIDGGAGTDTYVLMGAQGAETFRIYTRDAWLAVAGNNAASLNTNTEIVITRGGTDNNAIIAELDNIEEIKVNALNTTANNGNNAVAPDGGTSGGDTILVIGDFRSTSLDYNTIRVEGTGDNDTIDITGLESAHRVVFDSNGGSDTIIGQVRDQDIFTGEGINDQRTTAIAAASGDFGASDGLDALAAGVAAGGVELTRYMPVRDELATISGTGVDLIDFILQTDLMFDTDLGRTMVSQDHLVPLDIAETLETIPGFDRSSVSDLFVDSSVRHTSEGLAYILG